MGGRVIDIFFCHAGPPPPNRDWAAKRADLLPHLDMRIRAERLKKLRSKKQGSCLLPNIEQVSNDREIKLFGQYPGKHQAPVRHTVREPTVVEAAAVCMSILVICAFSASSANGMPT
jgi:hypothetical protein